MQNKGDEERRLSGDFSTPSIWVWEGRKCLDSKLGINWKSEYVIWDCCCGTGALTRGLSDVEIYSSTISEEDVLIARHLNSTSNVFQYDFLNEDVSSDDSLGTWDAKHEINSNADLILCKRSNLLSLLSSGSKSLLFLINPPYAASGNYKVDKLKTGVTETLIRQDIMKNSDIQSASYNLYSQFFYRILCLIKQFRNCNIAIACYVMTSFLTGPKFMSLRKAFEDEGYMIDGGFMFKGSEFSDCSNTWSVTFCVIRKRLDGEGGSMNEFYVTIKQRVLDKIKDISYNQCYYSVASHEMLSKYVRPSEVLEQYDAPQLSNPLSLSGSNGKGSNRGYMCKDGLGYLSFHANCAKTYTFTFGLSSCANMGEGFCLLPSNYDRAIVGFIARRLIKSDWKTERKEFMRPNESNINFTSFLLSSYILSVFIYGASWSSLRNFDYLSPLLSEKSRSKRKLIEVGSHAGSVYRLDERTYNIYNEFFWMSKSEIASLARKHNLNIILDDIHGDVREESFTYKNKILPNLDKFSEEGNRVLELGRQLVELSFSHRIQAINGSPDWHLEAWDAGWIQIKKLIESDYCKDNKELQSKYSEFKVALKALQDKNISLVYELGFLK